MNTDTTLIIFIGSIKSSVVTTKYFLRRVCVDIIIHGYQSEHLTLWPSSILNVLYIRGSDLITVYRPRAGYCNNLCLKSLIDSTFLSPCNHRVYKARNDLGQKSGDTRAAVALKQLVS